MRATFQRLFINAALALMAYPAFAEWPEAKLPSPFVVVDLNIGEEQQVRLTNGETVTVKLIDVQDHRDSLRGAVRRSEVKAEVAGKTVTVGAGTYHLPVTVSKVRFDCPITRGYTARANKMS